MVFECLLRGDEEVPFQCYGGGEMRLVVWDCEDFFVRAPEGAGVEMDLETFCSIDTH